MQLASFTGASSHEDVRRFRACLRPPELTTTLIGYY